MNTQIKTKGMEQLIAAKLNKFSIERLQQVLDFVEFLELRQQQSSNASQQEGKSKSFLAIAEKYAGCLDGGPSDLSSNKKYLEDLGTE